METEQVRTQQETIERLTKTVETLEKELEKCLHPGKDGDGNRTHINYKFPKSHRFNAVAQNIVNGVFLTANVFTPVESKGSGRYDEQHKKYLWKNLEQAIFNADNLGDYWIKPEFRHGLRLIASTHLELTRECKLSSTSSKGLTSGIGIRYAPVDPGDVTTDFLYFEHNIKAIECLLEIIPMLKLSTEYEVDLMLSLSTILFVLKLDGMDRSSDDDDDENEDE